MKQLNLLKPPSLQCGGSLHNTRSLQRTLCSKRPIHLVLKSKMQFSLFKNREQVRQTLKKQAKNFGITVHTWSIQKDHIHISLKIPNRGSYMRFIRALTGLLARQIGKGLWKNRPYTRVLSGSSKEFWNLNNYLFRNEMEIFGIWTYQDRRQTGFPATSPKIWTAT